MRLAKNALVIALTMLMLVLAASAQLRSVEDPRNTAPAVGTGGPPGGPTGLFTVYDGQTLRRGEYTFSAAYSNFDRDPGDVDIVEVPVSFQVGITNRFELFFNTDAYRAVKVNSPFNLSSFYLPNTTQFPGGVRAAIILSPATSGVTAGQPIFRPQGGPSLGFPFVGSLGNLGNFTFTGIGAPIATGPLFGFPVGTSPQTGSFSGTFFPGIGSATGSILPGIVLQFATVTVPPGGAGGGNTIVVPTVYSVAPSYLPDAPLINREYGTSSFSTMTFGGKWRWTSNESPYGVGIIPFYRWYADEADEAGGFNQLQRGSSAGGGCFPTRGCWNPSGNRGDLGVIFFADGRMRSWLNVSFNLGYVFNSDIKADFAGFDDVTLLDRPNEILYGVALDFPVNRYFQPILEFRGTRYHRGQENALENHPMDALAGARLHITRWFGIGGAYRMHLNQQNRSFFEDSTFTRNVDLRGVSLTGGTPTLVPIATSTGTLAGIARESDDPHGFIFQAWIGRRNERGGAPILNQPANVESVNLDRTSVTLPCPPGQTSRSGQCPESVTVGVSTVARDPENDVLTYSYTVSGGRIVGQGANVSWDLSGVQPGTYTVTSAVDDGCGFCGTTQTSTVTVANCADCELPPRPCVCPQLFVTGPSGVTQPGSTMTFTANVSGGSQDGQITYSWTVSQGSIVSGQGTPVITVDTTGLRDTNVTAEVNIGGAPNCPCTTNASATGPVAGIPEAEQVDEFGRLSNNDIKQRADQFAIRLQNDPSATGYIVIWGPARQVAARETLIRNYLIQNRGIDPGRLQFVRGGVEPEIRTQFWFVPAGASPPNF